MIKILIVDDSRTETRLLKSLFESAPDLQVIGCAQNGEEALKLTASLKPDLITMDLAMPILDGLKAIRLIMSQNPTPIVVISSRLNDFSLNASFKALSAGALAVLDKPQFNSPSFQPGKTRLIETVRCMAEIKVVKRRFQTGPLEKRLAHPELQYSAPREAFEILAIGSSVGGPQALKAILSKLALDFPIPIVVVQHMTEGFIHSFTQWLDKHVALHVKEAQDQELLLPGTVYFAPDKAHLEIGRRENKLYAKLSEGKPVSGFYPSVTVLLKSVAKVSAKNAIGVLLTGMGNDGALGLLDLKNAEGHTLTQDPKSAVVYGMAGVAHSLGAVDRIVDLTEIADYLTSLTKIKEMT